LATDAGAREVTPAPADPMEIRLLGPVELVADGQTLAAGPPQQRLVIAGLAVDVGRPVAVGTLIGRVWNEPPPRARDTLYVLISRVRRLLEQADRPGRPQARLARGGGGYLLQADPDVIDMHRFHRLVTEARRADHTAGQRVDLLREAVGLWRGEPLSGLAGWWAERTRQAWRQRYLEAAVAWAHAELQVGNPAVVVAPLIELASEHPFDESVAAVLMRALRAAGRPTDALDRYAVIRRRLADEVGTDPGPELRALHRAILRGDIEPRPAAPAGPAARAVPAQLPADVPGFAGRTDHLAYLDSLLTGWSETPSTAVVISAVSGMAGIGKTALAVHWAHTVVDRFPDGQLYVNLRGFGPEGQAVSPAEAVRGFLDALGVPPEGVPGTVDAQAALYRSLVAGRRILVVLDNARDAEHVRPLLPGAPTALVVVTSRNQLTALTAAGAHPVMLDVLSPAEARELLVRRLDRDRVAAEPDAVERIINACARLPLGLGIAGARARQSGFALATIAAELDQAQAEARLDALATGDPASDVRAVFSWSYATLTPPAAQLFRLLGLHPGPDFSAPALASLGGHAVAEVRRLLSELARASLMAQHVPGRYTVHDLLHMYAADLAGSHDPEELRRAAMTRLLDHWVHTAYAADRLLHAPRGPIPLPLAPPAVHAAPERLDDLTEAMEWLTAEWPVLCAAIPRAGESGFHTHAWQLVWAVTTFLDRQGHWQRLASVWRVALRAAEHLTDVAARAYSHRLLARVESRLGHYEDSHAHLRQALALYSATGDLVGQATTHRSWVFVWDQQGRPDEALDHARQALALYRAAGQRAGEADALNGIGWCNAQLGNYAVAIDHCEQAAALLRDLDDRPGEAAAWDSLGYAHHHLGHYRRAVDCYRHALGIYTELGERYEKSATLIRLGETHHDAGNRAAAGTVWRRALDILTDLDHPAAGDLRARVRTLDESEPYAIQRSIPQNT
jgi:DNA-binding SARP family transcriptional activator